MLTTLLLLLFVGADIPKPRPTLLAGSLQKLQEVHPLTEEEVRQYLRKSINKKLTDRARDTSELPALRNRLNYFFGKNRAEEIMIYPELEPNKHSPLIMLHVQPSAAERRLNMYLFIPALKEFQIQVGNDQEFGDYMAYMFAVEAIFHELIAAGELPWDQVGSTEHMQKARAMAAGKGIIEILRPLQQQGRLNTLMMEELSKRLEAVGNNYRAKEWIDFFRPTP